jgi:hypothetical protein
VTTASMATIRPPMAITPLFEAGTCGSPSL